MTHERSGVPSFTLEFVLRSATDSILEGTRGKLNYPALPYHGSRKLHVDDHFDFHGTLGDENAARDQRNRYLHAFILQARGAVPQATYYLSGLQAHFVDPTTCANSQASLDAWGLIKVAAREMGASCHDARSRQQNFTP